MTPPPKYRTILLFGLPGSGKGTQGAVLGQLPDLVHVSCGDIFRRLPKSGELGRAIAHHTAPASPAPRPVPCGDIFRRLPKSGELGREIVHYTAHGALVPDDLTVRIWERHIK